MPGPGSRGLRALVLARGGGAAGAAGGGGARLRQSRTGWAARGLGRREGRGRAA